MKTRLWLLPRPGLTRHVAWNLRRPAVVLAGTGVWFWIGALAETVMQGRIPLGLALTCIGWLGVVGRLALTGYRVVDGKLETWSLLWHRKFDLAATRAVGSQDTQPWAPLCVQVSDGREFVLHPIPWRDRGELFDPEQILERAPVLNWPSLHGRRWRDSRDDFDPPSGERVRAPRGRWASPFALSVVAATGIAGVSYLAWPWHAANYADAAVTTEAHRELEAAMTAIAAAQSSDGATVSGERVLACLDGAGGTFRLVNTRSDEFALAAGRVLESRGWTAVAPAEWVKLVYTSTDAVGLRVGRLPGARFVDPRISAALGEADGDGWIGTALGQPCETKMVWPWQA